MDAEGTDESDPTLDSGDRYYSIIIVLLYIYTYNSSSETEAKRSAILFLRRTLQGA